MALKKLQDFMKSLLLIYNPLEIALLTVFFYGGSFGYFYLVSKDIIASLIMGAVGFSYFFFVQSYKTRKLETYQTQLNNCLKYVTNMKFFLQTGENVLYSFMQTLPTVTDKTVRKDIEQVVEGLEHEAVLDTTIFEKYEFPALNQFHKNLSIAYEQGGDPKELFDPIQRNIMFELDKRDELYKKRKGVAMNVYVLVGLVAVIPILLRFMVADLWAIFLDSKIISLGTLSLSVIAMLLLLTSLQKKKVDISVRI